MNIHLSCPSGVRNAGPDQNQPNLPVFAVNCQMRMGNNYMIEGAHDNTSKHDPELGRASGAGMVSARVTMMTLLPLQSRLPS